MSALQHIPVLCDEVLEALPLREGAIIVDATLGLGGHSQYIAQRIGATGTLIAFEWDKRNMIQAQENLSKHANILFCPFGFSHLTEQCHAHGITAIDGILFDLGISSAHLDDGDRGFSYRFDAPLDLRMNQNLEQTGADILSTSSEKEIADVFYHYGEETRSRVLAKKIVEIRKETPILTTLQLFHIIEQVCPHAAKKTASRVFQALRIAVNKELDEIESALPQACGLLRTNGVIGVISFHSLEDRLIKNFFRDQESKDVLEERGKKRQKKWQRIQKKPITPGETESRSNPRSRSAKLRLLTKNF